MRRLILFRHAKSDWPTGIEDEERPLVARGRQAAVAMAHYMVTHHLIPDVVVVSTARRTRETCDLLAPVMNLPAPTYDARIYEAPAENLFGVVREAADAAKTLMLIGHNPGLEDLALLLIGNGDLDARRRLHTKFPTAGLCVIDLPQQGWAALHPGGGRLERFVTPKMLGADPD